MPFFFDICQRLFELGNTIEKSESEDNNAKRLRHARPRHSTPAQLLQSNIEKVGLTAKRERTLKYKYKFRAGNCIR